VSCSNSRFADSLRKQAWPLKVEKGINAAILVNFCASTNEYSTTYERTLIAETPQKNPSTATPDYNSFGSEHS
jgi:hypothetical protein